MDENYEEEDQKKLLQSVQQFNFIPPRQEKHRIMMNDIILKALGPTSQLGFQPVLKEAEMCRDKCFTLPAPGSVAMFPNYWYVVARKVPVYFNLDNYKLVVSCQQTENIKPKTWIYTDPPADLFHNTHKQRVEMAGGKVVKVTKWEQKPFMEDENIQVDDILLFCHGNGWNTTSIEEIIDSIKDIGLMDLLTKDGLDEEFFKEKKYDTVYIYAARRIEKEAPTNGQEDEDDDDDDDDDNDEDVNDEDVNDKDDSDEDDNGEGDLARDKKPKRLKTTHDKTTHATANLAKSSGENSKEPDSSDSEEDNVANHYGPGKVYLGDKKKRKKKTLQKALCHKQWATGGQSKKYDPTYSNESNESDIWEERIEPNQPTKQSVAKKLFSEKPKPTTTPVMTQGGNASLAAAAVTVSGSERTTRRNKRQKDNIAQLDPTPTKRMTTRGARITTPDVAKFKSLPKTGAPNDYEKMLYSLINDNHPEWKKAMGEAKLEIWNVKPDKNEDVKEMNLKINKYEVYNKAYEVIFTDMKKKYNAAMREAKKAKAKGDKTYMNSYNDLFIKYKKSFVGREVVKYVNAKSNK